MRTVLLLILAALVVAPAVGAQTAPRFQASGFYLVGSPVAYFAIDACGMDPVPTNGLDSSCVPLPAGLEGSQYTLTFTDSLGSVASIGVCFYSDAGFIGCDLDAVPPGATAFSVSSFGGVGVEWTFTVA